MTDDTDGRQAQPDGIVPDTKDWTWAVERRCEDCGFDPAAVDPLAVGDAVRATVPAWQAVLARPDVRRRPAPGVWSPLEYSAHVRDVFRIFDERLALMLRSDGAMFENWDQDAAALAGRYAQADPTAVATELADAGASVAERFDTVRADQLERVGRRSNGSTFTVRTFGRYFLHDVVHHLHDVRG
ncbi:DinB family protein [Isoptericola croceus]|uniref:DinB family protein n=1 Tax=Isoptericola croceus TaxID=3031406 RepID=UPI0023F79165|nr:DinB family protein [Isoptericola croceus]